MGAVRAAGAYMSFHDHASDSVEDSVQGTGFMCDIGLRSMAYAMNVSVDSRAFHHN